MPASRPGRRPPGRLSRAFDRLSRKGSAAVGSPWAFTLALLFVVAWAASGPLLGFSEVWQLTINTGTTIVTFLIVFLLQHSQSRDTTVLQLKLDEVLDALRAGDRLIDLEEGEEDEIESVKDEFRTRRRNPER